MKETPNKNEFTELSVEDRTTKLSTLMGTLTEDEIKASYDLQKLLKVEANKLEEKPDSGTLSAVVKTMINTESSTIEKIYGDSKFLIENVNGLKDFTDVQKLTILNSIVEPAAKALEKQATTLKSESSTSAIVDGIEQITTQNSGKETGQEALEKVFTEMSSAGLTIPNELKIQKEKTD